jgi:pimeloyl-ACP methyl ester carboxylesterase
LPDNRLSGRSSCRRLPKDTADLAADVKALLDHLGVAKAAIAGHSMGGYAAQEFALAFPKMTSALVLESTAAASSGRNNALFAALADTLKREGYTESFWRAMFCWLLSPALYDQKPDDVEMCIKAARGYPHLPTAENFGRMTGLITKHDARDRLRRIQAPCLVLCGGRDPLVSVEESRALADGIPDARFVCVKDAGHTVHLEQPEAFARAVDSFLSGQAVD